MLLAGSHMITIMQARCASRSHNDDSHMALGRAVGCDRALEHLRHNAPVLLHQHHGIGRDRVEVFADGPANGQLAIRLTLQDG